jgi:hypothetical protein
MYALPGETRASNKGAPIKDGGVKIIWGLITLVIPNHKARHRNKASGLVLKYELHYIQNRWYSVYRPRYRRLMQRLKLRK